MGVPQGSVIGPALCNIVLDGLQDELYKVMPVKTQLSKYELQYVARKTKKPIEKLSRYITKRYPVLLCIRYADDILIMTKAGVETVNVLQEKLLAFLNSRGLEIKNPSKFQGFVFKPGQRFDFLGFTFIFPNPKDSSFINGPDTRLKNSPITFGYTKEGLKQLSRKPYVTISKISLNKMRDDIKKTISVKNVTKPLEQIIGLLNAKLRGYVNYYGITSLTRAKLSYLNDLIHRRLYKFLLRKHSSAPKIYALIRERYIHKGTFKVRDRTLLKVHRIVSSNNLPVHQTAPTIKWLNSNVYLDNRIREEQKKYSIRLMGLRNLNYSSALGKEEVIALLHDYQDQNCPYCKEPIDLIEQPVELDHKPAIYELKSLF